MTFTNLTYELTDGEQMARDYPESFFIPPQDVKDQIMLDDYVKAGFQWKDGLSERIWCKVVGFCDNDTKMMVSMSNVPVDPGSSLSYEDTFILEDKHVLDIQWSDDR